MSNFVKFALGVAAALIALATSNAHAVETPGMKVVKDAATGELRMPTAAEEREMNRAAQRSVKKTQGVAVPVEGGLSVNANGTVRADVPEEMMVYSVVSVNPDGTLGKMQCVTGKDAADKFVNSKAKEQNNVK